jgi:glutamate--cysteine ligase
MQFRLTICDDLIIQGRCAPEFATLRIPMSTRQDVAPGTSAPSRSVSSRDELVAWIAAGSKPAAQWRIGTEHEKFVFNTADRTPVPYAGPAGIRALMEGLIARHGWEAIMEGAHIIALKRPKGQGSETISLEPGGQFELSGAPLETLHQVHAETAQHLSEVRDIGATLGLGFLGAGFSPLWQLDKIPKMPKQRYGVMTRYMPQVGKGGLDMMYRTCTIQVNLDFSDEADMVKKFRVSLALQPIATALFAASPFTEGRPNGFKSMRSEVWRDTDTRRTGMLPFVFEPGMSFERYVDYALDVPMYFVYRDGTYIDVAGASFRDFMAGKLAALPGMLPTIDDWSDHVTTLFPEVRMKRFLEMRGADCGPEAHVTALPAFWVGLLYNQTALDAAWDLVRDWTADERQGLRDLAPKLALDAPFRRGKLGDIAKQAVVIAQTGLRDRARAEGGNLSEAGYLDGIAEIATTGKTLADRMLTAYLGPWRNNVDPIFRDYAF